jgi:hypothetical protein
MQTALARGLVMALGLVLMSGLAVAHHGDAGRYEDTLTSVSGIVLELQLLNPHSFLQLETTEPNGRTVRWTGELGRPSNLRDWCWNEDVIKAGDRVTMVGRSRKNGQPYMSLSEEARVIDANGKEIFRGNEPNQPREPGPCAEQ